MDAGESPGDVVGDFLQDAAVSMNWCEMSSIDSLWLSLQMQWQGVGTLTPTCISTVD